MVVTSSPDQGGLAAAQRARELVEPGLDPSLQRQVEGLLARITSEKDGARRRP